MALYGLCVEGLCDVTVLLCGAVRLRLAGLISPVCRCEHCLSLGGLSIKPLACWGWDRSSAAIGQAQIRQLSTPLMPSPWLPSKLISESGWLLAKISANSSVFVLLLITFQPAFLWTPRSLQFLDWKIHFRIAEECINL